MSYINKHSKSVTNGHREQYQFRIYIIKLAMEVRWNEGEHVNWKVGDNTGGN